MKKLKPHKVDWAQIERFLASADKKLASAHKILAFDEEACLEQAYEAMLKASLGLLFSHSFRVRSNPGHHIAIIESLGRVTTKNLLVCSPVSSVSGGSEIWRFMTTGDSFRTMTLSRPSKPRE